MANVSISQVAKQWKVSRPTILKRLKSGELSGVKDDSGKWEIDSSEVIRCFGEPDNVSTKEPETVVTPLQQELTAALRDQIATLKGQLDETNQLNRDLTSQMGAQTRLLEHQQPKSLMQKVFGKAA